MKTIFFLSYRYLFFILHIIVLCLIISFSTFSKNKKHKKIKATTKWIAIDTIKNTKKDQIVKYVAINKKKGYKKLGKKEQSQALGIGTAKIMIGTLCTAGVSCLFPNLSPVNSISSALLSSIIGNIIIKPLGEISSLTLPFLQKSSLRKLNVYKKKYFPMKEKLSLSMQGFFEDIFERYSFLIRKKDRDVKEFERCLEEILNLPIQVKHIQPNLINIKNFLNNYNEDVRLSISNFIVNVIEDSKIQKLTKKATPLMLVGPPGTGKTYLAKNLGMLLGVSVQLIDLSTYKNIHGSSFWSNDTEAGIITDILRSDHTNEKNFANKILILDEVDKVLACNESGQFLHPNGAKVATFLHHLLEGNTTEFSLRRYHNASHDIAHLKIILIGNQTFSEVLGPQAAALENRIRLIKFGKGFTKEKKESIMNNYVTTICDEYHIDTKELDQTILNDILDMDIQLGFKGVRVLLSIVQEYIHYLKNKKLIEKLAEVECKKFDIKKAYLHFKKPNHVQSKNN